MRAVAAWLFVLSVTAVAGLYAAGWTLPITPEEAVTRELRAVAPTAVLNDHVTAALDRGDVDEARMYADIASLLGRTLPAETLARLTEAESLFNTGLRAAGDFVSAFVTGEALTTAGLAGAVLSDLTVVGDVRDLTVEGGKALAGESYSELILGLSAVGLTATAATVATGGGGITAKAGISVAKVAARAGTLTADFARWLGRAVGEAVDLAALRGLARGGDLSVDAVRAVVRSDKAAEVTRAMARIGEISEAAGPGETVRLMKFVRNGETLDDVAQMTKTFGKRSRGIMELTGKTSLRAFKLSLNILEFLIERILWVAGWFGALLMGMLRKGATRGAGAILRWGFRGR